MTADLKDAFAQADQDLSEADQNALASLIHSLVREGRQRQGWSRQDMSVLHMIRLILLVDWDPIGVFGPAGTDGEYDSYVPGLFEILRQGGEEPEICAYLHEIEEGQMSCSVTTERRIQVANKILSSYRFLCQIEESYVRFRQQDT